MYIWYLFRVSHSFSKASKIEQKISEDRPIPEFLEPIDGTGLADSHPAIILCVMVKKSEKKKHKK